MDLMPRSPVCSRRCLHPGVLLVVLLGSLVRMATAYSEIYAPPPEVVQRSDVIVVAHVKGESFPVLEPDDKQSDNRPDYSAVLEIKEVLKGQIAPGETPIAIRFNLHPTPWQDSGEIILVGGGMHDAVSDDIRKDRIWFLRKGPPHDAKGDLMLGISHPQDTDEVILKPFYAAFLTADPEKELRKHVKDKPEKLAKTCSDYLINAEIKRVVQNTTTREERVDKLLPYLLYEGPRERAGQGPPYLYMRNLRDNDARFQLTRIRRGVGKRLVPIFFDSRYAIMEFEIIELWEEVKYKEAVPYIAAVLEREGQNFEKLSLIDQTSWLEHSPNFGEMKGCDRGLVEECLDAIGRLGDLRGREVVERTLKRWETVEAPDRWKRITGMCKEALARIANAEGEARALSVRWLGPGESNLDFRSLIAQGRRFQPTVPRDFPSEPVKTREDAVDELFMHVSMPARPRIGFEDAEYFYFSGGTGYGQVDDFRSGIAIQKANGEMIKWGN